MRPDLLIKVLCCAAKLTTLSIPCDYFQTISQEAIDWFADERLSLEDNMPMPQSVLTGYDEVIVCAVEVLLENTDIFADKVDLYCKSPESLAEFLITQKQTVMKSYEEEYEHYIQKALTQYLTALKNWALQHTSFLRQNIEYLGSQLRQQDWELKALGKTVTDLVQKTDAQQLQINEIAITKVLDTVDDNSNDLNSLDIFGQDRSNEWTKSLRYFRTDDTISVDQFFFCENYHLHIMTSDNYTLQRCEQQSTEQNLDLNGIMEIVQSQPVVLISGLYGTGKTALLKRIYHDLRHGNQAVFFFHSKDLIDLMDDIGFTKVQEDKYRFNQKTLDRKVRDLTHGKNHCYILIDELDEMNIGVHNTSYLRSFLKWMCEYQAERKDVSFVLSSRKYAQIGMEREVCVADKLFEEFYPLCEEDLSIICTSHFTTDTRSKWIEEYAQNNGEYASYTDIKREYGKIASALKYPIFLYAFMQRFLEKKKSVDSKGYYYYYSSFVEKTVGGKYGIKHSKHENVGVSSDQYRIFLQKMAYRILQYSEKALIHEVHKSTISEEQPLLADELTNRKFEMPLSELGDILNTSEYKAAYCINCFFLSMGKKRVFFTDTNILFALASEYIFNRIESLIHLNNGEFHIDHLQEIELVRLYPHLVDYIIYLAQNSIYCDEIASYLISFVTNPTIRTHYLDLSTGSTNTVEKVLLLYILFMKINKGSYKTPDFQHIVKEIIYYVNAYKTNYYLADGANYAYTIERYFMGLDLHQLVLRRVNLKKFNFKGSKITGHCQFYQCKFSDTNMMDVTIANANFTLCDFSDVTDVRFVQKKGNDQSVQATFQSCNISRSHFDVSNIIFRNCKIDNLTLDLHDHQKVEFIDCHISKLKVKLKTYKSSSKPIFTRCILENRPNVPDFTRTEIDELIKTGKCILLD